MVQLARDYANRRAAFGKLLKDHALHVQTLARIEVKVCTDQLLTPLFLMTHHLITPPTWTGGNSWGVPHGHGCVSPVGSRGKRLRYPAGYQPAASPDSGGQAVYWQAGGPVRNLTKSHLVFMLSQKYGFWLSKEAGAIWNATVFNKPEDGIMNLHANVCKPKY